MIAHPKMSQIEWKTTEIRASKVGQRLTLFLPRLQLALLEIKVLGGSSVAAKDAGPQWAFYEWNVRKVSAPQIKERYGKGSHRDAGGAASATCAIQ